MIPFALGRALFGSLTGDKAFVEVAGGDHNDVRPPDERPYWRVVDTFVAQSASYRLQDRSGKT